MDRDESAHLRKPFIFTDNLYKYLSEKYFQLKIRDKSQYGWSVIKDGGNYGLLALMKIYYGLFSYEAMLKGLSAIKILNYGQSTFKVRILGRASLQ